MSRRPNNPDTPVPAVAPKNKTEHRRRGPGDPHRSAAMRVAPHILALCLGLTGCRFTPSATTKTVTTNDVVGVWSFTEDKTSVFTTFIPSGVFTQQLFTATQTNSQVGRWTLDGSHLWLTNFLAQTPDGWKPDSMHWYFIDGEKQKLELFGGPFSDPAAFRPLSYLRTAP